MKKTLLIMAAGLAARYGGHKQTESFGPNGEMLMEYSIRDARAQGFDKAVFIIGADMKETFEELIATRVTDIELDFAVQDHSSLPGGFSAPEGRTKPYGTVHAVLCARQFINEPFAVINADDYYGKQAFIDLAGAMERMSDRGEACMPVYPMKNTLSGSGTVTRGICRITDGRLTGIDETFSIKKCADGTIRSFDSSEDGEILNGEDYVSMNIFGFMPWIFDDLESGLIEFLKSLEPGELKKEYPLPMLLDRMIGEDRLKINVTPTLSTWFGVTYKEDKEMVERLLRDI